MSKLSKDDYVWRGKKALELLCTESAWFTERLAACHDEGYSGDEDLGGRFLMVFSDGDAEASEFNVAYKTVGTDKEIWEECSELVYGEWYIHSLFDLEAQQKLALAEFSCAIVPAEKVELA